MKQTNEQRWTRWLYQRFPVRVSAGQNMTDPGSVPYDVPGMCRPCRCAGWTR